MDIFQIILVIVGVGIAGSIFLKNSNSTKTTTSVTTPTSIAVNPTKLVENDQHAHDLMCLIGKWDALRRCCDEQGLALDDTCELLNKQLFPLWQNRNKTPVPAVKEEVKNE